MDEQPVESPKTFVSYSWTSPQHEEWVLQLATEMVENGVDVILDKWDLREGADKYAFMEKMVTDKTVRKVIIVCDRLYAVKADGREGGVGTETQIISPELYSKIDPADQPQKFVAVVTQKDEDGSPYLPTYLKGRIYIDMSDSDLRAQNFERLLRWIYDKPLYERPEPGRPPAHILKEGAPSLGTTSRFRQTVDALEQNKSTAPGLCSEYFSTFAENLERFRITREDGKELDDQVVTNIEAFLPFRDEAVNLFVAITRYRPDSEMYSHVHHFLESLLRYAYLPGHLETENFKFIVYELFVYNVAVLLKNKRFKMTGKFAAEDYYLTSDAPTMPQAGMVPFTFFNSGFPVLQQRNKRLGLRRLSLAADMVKDRAKRHDLPFSDVMQADFVLYLRTVLQPPPEGQYLDIWFPHTLLYAADHPAHAGFVPPFEIFARAQSMSYFDELKLALGIGNKKQLETLVGEYQNGKRPVPRWQFEEIVPSVLMGLDRIATKP